MSEMFDFSEYYDRVAQDLPDNCQMVEVGVANGESALYLAKRLFSLGKTFRLFMVDNCSYGGYDQLVTIYENIIKSGLGEFITVIPKDSITASEMFNGNSLHFVFIDSSHEYNSTKLEILAWYDKLYDGFTLAGHDFFSKENPGVGKAVLELLPKMITRASIIGEDYEQHFEPESFLHTQQTTNGNGIWKVEKNFYFTPGESLLGDCYVGYLNLPHRQDRDAHIRNQFKLAGIEAIRTRGRLPKEFDLTSPKLQVMKNRTAGAIGCHYGQVEIMTKALNNGKHAFVFEDDVILCSNFKERMATAETFLKGKNWQIFWLGGTYHYPEAWWHKPGHSTDLPQCNCTLGVDAEPTEHPNFMRTYGAFSTYCYIVNKNYIAELLSFLEENIHLSMGIDWLMILLQPHINAYAPNPGMAIQLDNKSDIGNGMTIFSGFKMLGEHWFADKL